MKLEMHKNSLFAVLLRSQWWVSLAVAAGAVAALRFVLPDVYAFFAAIPFIVIAGVAAWRQLRAPSAAQLEKSLAALRAKPWEEFAEALEAAFRREGYTVKRLDGKDADFELTKGWRVAVVGCKRWKVARTGIDPLRELHAARGRREAHECIYIAAGEVTENAAAFCVQKGIRLVRGPELARMIRL
jgi:restriction system protein